MLKCWWLLVFLCVTRKLPPGNLNLSVVLPVVTSTPRSLNAPSMTTGLLLPDMEADTIWKFSVPVTAWWALAGWLVLAG